MIAASARQVDCCGIVALMWGASLPTIHFGFVDDPASRNLHWLLISICSVICLTLTLHHFFMDRAGRTYRVIAFVGLGAFWIVFLLHGCLLCEGADQRRRFGLEWLALVASLNMTGAACYALRFPERWFPYRFDLVGSSHQIFHVAVLIAGIVHYKGMTEAFRAVRG
ncbi:hypothetical protein LTR17_017551 [Elasticomyces elasticus]|nr:hypothetical protein LTR17_017551 [Elasticomyces elasticus]